MAGAENYRGMMLDQGRRVLGDATNAIQFLQAGADGSRQGNLFLSSMPGVTSFNGYNGGSSTLSSYAVYGSSPVNRFAVAGP